MAISEDKPSLSISKIFIVIIVLGLYLFVAYLTTKSEIVLLLWMIFNIINSCIFIFNSYKQAKNCRHQRMILRKSQPNNQLLIPAEIIRIQNINLLNLVQNDNGNNCYRYFLKSSESVKQITYNGSCIVSNYLNKNETVSSPYLVYPTTGHGYKSIFFHRNPGISTIDNSLIQSGNQRLTQ